MCAAQWLSAAASIASFCMAFVAWRFANAAVKGARERHQYTVQKDEHALFFKGMEALKKGEDLNSLEWEPFFDLAKKREADARRRGLGFQSIFECWPQATRAWRPGADKEQDGGEQREAGAEGGSLRQTPASHHGSARRRTISPTKAAGHARDNSQHTLPTLERVYSALDSQDMFRTAGFGDHPDQ